jgi:hypothetical protein
VSTSKSESKTRIVVEHPTVDQLQQDWGFLSIDYTVYSTRYQAVDYDVWSRGSLVLQSYIDIVGSWGCWNPDT